MSTTPLTFYVLTKGTDDAVWTYDMKNLQPSVTESLTKSNIVVPIPQTERFGIDIGLTSDHSFRITYIEKTLANITSMRSYIGYLSNTYDFKLIYRDVTYYVLPNNWSQNDEAGKGDMVSCTLGLDIIKQPNT
jgi:hypothetical protein